MNFREKVFQITRKIPAGKVASYGQIAALAGSPRAARQVGWAMSRVSEREDVPWWRVVNKEGYLSIRNDDIEAKLIQNSLLEKEGIDVDKNFLLDMGKYRYKFSREKHLT